MLTQQVWMGSSGDRGLSSASGDGFNLDVTVWQWLQAFSSGDDPWVPAMVEVVRDATALGSNLVLAMLVTGVAGFLLLNQKKSLATWLVATAVTALLLNHGLKEWIDRARPDELLQAARVFTPSFPSAHAMLSATIYSALAVVITSHRSSTQNLYVYTVAGLLILLVGLSRLYLGVHWLTDVLGGWAVGLAWTWVSWQVWRKFYRERQTGKGKKQEE